MNNWFSINPVFPLATLSVVSLLFVFFGYKEFQRKQKFLTLRIIALCLVFISILGIFLRPSFTSEKNYGSVILLTKNYDAAKADSVVKQNSDAIILRTSEAKSYPNSTIIKSEYELSDKTILCVLGEGISHSVVDLLPNKNFRFIPVPMPTGIVELTLPETIYENQSNRIEGVYNANEKTILKLIGPNGVEDSVTINKGENHFSLSFKTKQAGLFLYKLESEKINERLPIEVLPEKQLRILIIQQYPTAEIKFLKNFLAERKHQLVMRYQTSKTNFNFEFANTPQQKFNSLNEDFLNSFDLLFIDEKSFNALTSNEKNNLKKSVSNGLGVIVSNEKLLNEFHSIKSKPSADTAHLHLSKDYTLSVLPVELNSDASIISVVKTKEHILLGYFFQGFGKVGFQFINETFALGLEGNKDDYALLWNLLIEKTSRAQNSNSKIKFVTPFPYYENQPIDFNEISSSENSTRVYADSILIPLIENNSIADFYNGKTWAGKSGWHQLNVKQDSTLLNYFVFNKDEWQSLRITNQIKEGKMLQRNSPIQSQHKMQQHIEVPPIIFYLLFLFASAFLWLAPKI